MSAYMCMVDIIFAGMITTTRTITDSISSSVNHCEITKGGSANPITAPPAPDI